MKRKVNRKRIKKILKRTGLALCTFVLTGTIAVGSYNAYLNNKLNDIEISTEDVNIIKNYYDAINQEITIFVMNDSQGVNLNLGFWKDSYPEYLRDILGAEVIDASSLRFNKVSHIDMLLDNNLSIAEMKRLNNAGAKYALEKYANENNLKVLRGLLSSTGVKIFGQKINDSDENIHISDLLRDTYEPIIIYSSRADDLMFAANANPNSLKKYDENGNVTNKYLYAESVLNNPETIETIMNSIERTFNKILTINPTSKIFVLSIYIPSAFSHSDYEVFVDGIKQYNSNLKELCDKYNICYIDVSELGEVYNNKDYDFHMDVVGHKRLASILISDIANNLYKEALINPIDYNYDNDGLEGYYEDLIKMIDTIVKPTDEEIMNNYYLNKVYSSQLKGKTTDSEICKKLIKTYK